ncbi:cytochrome b/b6 domain-containing protein [Rhodobacteraceae bacterium N5(2021)]|uniref:Cytochrome b/b6 domain-containing protein n=1 Tax=Gymnodinialimonas phycosphaerae TaxID=2841589 RepID=A0A975TY67_9RHOB|nr:cytochrome b/b6 domain-containing protein [Gymnodinialimonas phycosphaerae]MBY4893014.1 cytochrome b/b6 domain-containing protein [Gymnodinialimonas phycosphaerae]
MSNVSAYSASQVRLHWIIVILLAGQYLFHEGIADAWDARIDGTIPNEPFLNPHAIVGILILLLTLWRVGLRLRRGAPALPKEEPQALKIVAKITHLAFYVLLIGMPISGALAWVAGLELPAEAHEVAAKVMLALIVLHIAGALVQQFVLKTGVMERMSPRRMLKRGG